ncbi:MAG TPA: 16S rRNA (cytidine(1402)-2'-O)-methyltransferase [Mycobacteriales bacterium]|nr:16S rRNA (cytidine(1402)-2'-O)-methyltransferase [Mycobacteriales bacterium]
MSGVDPHPGRLLLAATPLGNPDDASPRLAASLLAADVIAAEDTRRLRRLTTDLGIAPPGRVVSYFEGNESARTPELLEDLRAGRTVVLVTDAGMPSVSDPGYRLVAAAVAEDLPVTCVPGPSAVTLALAVSGLPADRFCFEGFLPRRSAKRRSTLQELAGERRTLIFFEAPHRLAEMLADAAAVFGAERPAAVCRELTKTYEEVRRGALGELAEWAAAGVRGEITVVVEGAPAAAATPEAMVELARDLQAEGLSRRDVADRVAARLGTSRRLVYDALNSAGR